MRTKYLNKRPLCGCGCGGFVEQSKLSPYQWNIFIRGHHGKGKPCSEKTRIKISKSRIEKYADKNAPMFGKGRSEKTKIRISKSCMGKHAGQDHYVIVVTFEQILIEKNGLCFIRK